MDIYECTIVPAVIYIPDNAIKIELIATIMDKDNQIKKIGQEITLNDVIEARKNGEDWANAFEKWKLTPEAQKFLDNGGTIEELLNKEITFREA